MAKKAQISQMGGNVGLWGGGTDGNLGFIENTTTIPCRLWGGKSGVRDCAKEGVQGTGIKILISKFENHMEKKRSWRTQWKV